MKTYKGMRSTDRSIVTVDGQQLPMKRRSDEPATIRFAWGERSDGAQQLALSLLADCLDEDQATILALAQAFMDEVISELPAEWEITSDKIEQWRNYACEVAYGVENDKWTPVDAGQPLEMNEMPAYLPRLLIDRNGLKNV